ncbi:hypothetical protein HGRIS_000133 [Hohenbuehelia grisea]|uniref:Uncharacterized protein n=1 Tax=Hohenbuehelia grisea TaxID=104357 RepID=A0ABR3JR37_9AGAR
MSSNKLPLLNCNPSPQDKVANKFSDAPPFVSHKAAKAHLRTIGAFLEISRQAGYSTSDSQNPSFIAFLSRAVARLEIWLEKVIGRTADRGPILAKELPPLDVAMALHSYMLSPRLFRDDAVGTYPQLKALLEFPWERLADLVDPATFRLNPTAESISHWTERTEVAFDPFEYGRSVGSAQLRCPNCSGACSISWSIFTRSAFTETCKQCGLSINRDALCVSKFLTTLREIQQGVRTNLRGVQLDDHAELVGTTQLVTRRILDLFPHTPGRQLTVSDLTSSDIATALEEVDAPRLSSANVSKVYSHPYTFSVDIPGLILHFQPLHELFWQSGWCSQAFLKGRSADLALDVAYSRYCSFLEICANDINYEATMPAKDADLFWHSHQLMSAKYKSDMNHYLHYFLDHVEVEVELDSDSDPGQNQGNSGGDSNGGPIIIMACCGGNCKTY